MSGQTDIRDVLGEIQQSKNLFTNNTQRGRVAEILKHFHKVGLTLEVCADERHLDRAITTLQQYARELNLAFPDYVPMHLRPKKEKKAKAA